MKRTLFFSFLLPLLLSCGSSSPAPGDGPVADSPPGATDAPVRPDAPPVVIPDAAPPDATAQPFNLPNPNHCILSLSGDSVSGVVSRSWDTGIGDTQNREIIQGMDAIFSEGDLTHPTAAEVSCAYEPIVTRPDGTVTPVFGVSFLILFESAFDDFVPISLTEATTNPPFLFLASYAKGAQNWSCRHTAGSGFFEIHLTSAVPVGHDTSGHTSYSVHGDVRATCTGNEASPGQVLISATF